MALAPSVFARCDDSSGTVIDIFRAACKDFGAVALQALADQTFDALIVNDYASSTT